jgi:hypothetical protein
MTRKRQRVAGLKAIAAVRTLLVQRSVRDAQIASQRKRMADLEQETAVSRLEVAVNDWQGSFQSAKLDPLANQLLGNHILVRASQVEGATIDAQTAQKHLDVARNRLASDTASEKAGLALLKSANHKLQSEIAEDIHSRIEDQNMSANRYASRR